MLKRVSRIGGLAVAVGVASIQVVAVREYYGAAAATVVYAAPVYIGGPTDDDAGGPRGERRRQQRVADGLCGEIYNCTSDREAVAAVQRAIDAALHSTNEAGGVGAAPPRGNDAAVIDLSPINAAGHAGVTPLMVAAHMGFVNAVALLLDQVCADPEVATSMSAIQTGGDAWYAYFPRISPFGGLRAFEFAIIGGHAPIVEHLIENSAKDPTVTGKSSGGNTASAPPQMFPMMFGGAMVIASGPSGSRDPSLPRWRELVTHSGHSQRTIDALNSAIDAGKQKREAKWRALRQQFPLESRLASQLVGQTQAIQAVSSAVRRKENGWFDSDAPLVMLFMGSSGIGKTRTAKLVADYLTERHSDPGKCFIRVDMTEYQHKHEVSKFIGSPPGYVGHEQGGQIVERLQQCPQAVVLLDEVEKAHPDVLTVLLQAFDEGRLTDGKGKTVDCRDAVFIMTSNLAQREIANEAVRLRSAAQLHQPTAKEGSGAVTKHGERHSSSSALTSAFELTKSFRRNVVQPILRSHFGRDEFIGRINEIVYFLPFNERELAELAERELQIWSKRAREKHNICLEWDPSVIALAADGYDLRYGARSVKFEIDRLCIGPIARAQEEGLLGRGDRVVIGAAERSHGGTGPELADDTGHQNDAPFEDKEEYRSTAAGSGVELSVPREGIDKSANSGPPRRLTVGDIIGSGGGGTSPTGGGGAAAVHSAAATPYVPDDTTTPSSLPCSRETTTDGGVVRIREGPVLLTIVHGGAGTVEKKSFWRRLVG